MKVTQPLVTSIVYISLVVGMAWGKVGQAYEGGEYTWWLPIQVFVFVAITLWLGFDTARRHYKL